MLLSVLPACFGLLLGCAIAAGELLALAERPNGSTAFDSSITSWMVVHRTHDVTTVAGVFSTWGGQTVVGRVVGIAAAAVLWRRELASAAFLIAAWGGATLLYNLTKHFVGRPRPPSSIWLTNVGRSTSFPSGHATQSLATWLAVALVTAVSLRRTQWPAIVLAVILAAGVGWSRVYLCVHWTTDVLAGWLIATAWIGILTELLPAARSIERQRRRPRPTAVIPNG
jgi:membrane-associated phospholipid phosphatase